MPKLNPKQTRFVQEYLLDLNATQAAIRAGYSAKTAEQQGPRLLGHVGVAESIAKAQQKRAAKVEVKSDDIVKEWLHLAMSDISEILDFTGPAPRLRQAEDIPAHARRAIQAIKVKRYMEGHGDDAEEVEVTEFKLWDKNTALVNLAKHLGMMVNRHEVKTTEEQHHILEHTLDLEGLTDEQKAQYAGLLEVLIERGRARARESASGLSPAAP